MTWAKLECCSCGAGYWGHKPDTRRPLCPECRGEVARPKCLGGGYPDDMDGWWDNMIRAMEDGR